MWKSCETKYSQLNGATLEPVLLMLCGQKQGLSQEDAMSLTQDPDCSSLGQNNVQGGCGNLMQAELTVTASQPWEQHVCATWKYQ